jgi:hypothetical protein
MFDSYGPFAIRFLSNGIVPHLASWFDRFTIMVAVDESSRAFRKLSGTAVVPVSAAAAVTVSDIVSISRRMEGGPDGSIGRLGVGVRSALFAAGELAALPVERGGVLALAVFAPKRPENQLVMVLYLLRKSRKSACHGISYGVLVRSTGTSMVC